MLFLVLFSCKGADNNQLIAKEVVFPSNVEIFDKFNTGINIHDADIKIIHCINGNCGACIKDLERWKLWIDEFSGAERLSFLFYMDVYNKDVFQVLQGEKLKVHYPILLDDKKLFWEKNSFIDPNTYPTLLVYENRILAFGEPMMSDMDRENFEDIIFKILSGKI